MTLYQLPNPIGVYVTTKEMEGRALGWIEYGPEMSLGWIVVLENHEVWITKNEEIRILPNWSLDYVHK